MQAIYFAGTRSWGPDPASLLAEFAGLKRDNICIVDSPSQADIVFVKETIDSLSCFVSKCLNVRVRIFWGQEAIYPDFNIFDYAIGFPEISLEESRYAQMHPLHFFQRYLKNSNIFERNEIKCLENKIRFCDFIYSNPYAHPFRDQFFLELSKHMYVNSPGKHMHNCDEQGISRGDWNGSWREDKVDYQSNSYFSIAFENACFPGYTSEKIITSFLARSVPIYWGDKFIAKYFNPASFVHCNSIHDSENTILRTLSLYSDKAEYLKVLNMPIMTDSQFMLYKNQLKDTQNFLLQALSTPQVLRPLGTFATLYESDWIQRYYSRIQAKKKLFRYYIRTGCLGSVVNKCKRLLKLARL